MAHIITSFLKVAVVVAFSALILCIQNVECSCSTVTTFNTALLPRATGYNDRRYTVPDAIRNENVDFMCLQEVWFEKDLHRLISTTKDVYPYHYSYLHSAVGDGPKAEKNFFPETPCSATDAAYFYSVIFPCALYHGCYGQFQDSFTLGLSCATSNCASLFRSRKIRPQCITCITLTATSVTNLVGGCTSEVRGRDNRLNDAGLVILSKRPLNNVQYKSFFPDKDLTLPRSYIQAEPQGIAPVICTHLTALFNVYFEYDLALQNYTNQQQEEIGTLYSVYGTSPHFVAGDLNTGPQVSSSDAEKRLVAEGGEQYQMLMDLGYRSPYMEQDGRCTYCSSNSLLTDAENNAIDQVLIMSDATSTITSERVLDTEVNGMALSDHYGVRTTICSP